MLNTTQAVKDAIYAPSRRVVGKVTFDITDVTAYDDVTGISGSTQVGYNSMPQVTNRERAASRKMATYEDTMFTLDGTITFPDRNPAENGETGFVSNTLCGADCTWSPVPFRGRLSMGDQPLKNITFSIQSMANTELWHNLTSDDNGIFYHSVPDGVYQIHGIWVDPTWYAFDGYTFVVSNGLVFGQEMMFNTQVGYIGYQKPTLVIEFGQSHSSAGLTVTFDETLGEYAVDYTVIALDEYGDVIDEVAITGNTQVRQQLFGQLYNYRTLEIIIEKWSKPYRRARIAEVDFGIVKDYEADGLIRLGLVEDLDLTSGQVPSAEFTFEVDNIDRSFNILNPTGFYKYLQERQKIYASLGVELDSGAISYIPLGEYFLAEWTSNEGAMTATFMARTSLDLMSSYPYEGLAPNEQSLYSLAEEVFSICGITKYSLDESLEDVLTTSLAKRTDCRSVLQMIAIAGCCNIFVDRKGVIHLTKIDNIGSTQDVITFDNTYSEPQIQLEKIVKKVEVSFWTSLETSEVVSVSQTGVGEGDTLTLTENTLINDTARAMIVATWLLAQRNNRRAKYSVDFRGNPAYELGDTIEIENSYGDNKKVIITKNALSYEGYLRVKTEARGVVE